jgi:hypothetical protein
MPICHHWGETCGHHKVLIHKQSFVQGSVVSGSVALNMTVLVQFSLSSGIRRSKPREKLPDLDVTW